MKRQFEARLNMYKDLAADLENKEANEVNIAAEQALAWLKKKSGNLPEVQERIYEIQKKKQEVMARLKEEIRLLGDPEYHEEPRSGARPVRYVGGELMATREIVEANRKLVTQPNGRKNWQWEKTRKQIEEPITTGELLTDGEWGINYQLDESVPRIIRKQYLIKKARREIENYLNQQIISEELALRPGHRAYQALAEDLESGQNKEKMGFIAEKMVQNFFIKLKEDFGIEYSVVAADVYQDVQQTIDFFIRRQRHTRGVTVEEGEQVGVQLTIDDSWERQRRKKRQVEQARKRLNDEDIDDIVLVTIPMTKIKEYFNEWYYNHMEAPGGPDKLWDNRFREKVLRGVLKDFISPEEIDALWEKIQKQS